MGVHMPTLRDADRGIESGGSLPSTAESSGAASAAPAAVPQLQDSQQHKEALARTWEWRFGAHAPRCLMCTRRSASAPGDGRCTVAAL